MNNENITNILREIEQGYNLISGKFSQTRKHFWRSLEFIKKYAKNGDKVLDFGCGNGRLAEFLSEKNISYWGIDISEKLIEKARNAYQGNDIIFEKMNSSQSSLPFEDNFFNTIYSIAVFHHFPGSSYRESSMREINRVTKSGGYIIITVWNLWQKKYLKNILKNWKDKLLEKSKLDWNDCYISFKDNQGNQFNRFHHAFTLGELKRLVEKSDFKIELAEKIGKNLVVVGRKTRCYNC